MFVVTNTELYATTKHYACTVEDKDGNEYEFTLKEIDNLDLGTFDNAILWLGEVPESIDEDELINACYSEINKNTQP